MEHEVVPCSPKTMIMLNSSLDHFGLHQGKIVKVIMKLEVPKWSLKPTLSTFMVQRVLQR